MRALYPAFGSTGGVTGSASPSVRGRSVSRRGAYSRASSNRPVNNSPVPLNGNITSIAAAITSGIGRPVALRNLPINSPAKIGEGPIRGDDSDEEPETRCVEVMVLGKIIGNTIPDPTYVFLCSVPSYICYVVLYIRVILQRYKNLFVL